jgi:hypothetical protein
MNWHLVHSDVAVTGDSGIVSKSYIIIEKDGTQFEMGKILAAEDHILGSKRVLIDTANTLKRLAREMESKADRLK